MSGTKHFWLILIFVYTHHVTRFTRATDDDKNKKLLEWETCGLRHNDPFKNPRSGSTRALAFPKGTYYLVHGTLARDGEYPWFVSLLANWTTDNGELRLSFCAGALLNSRWVLTVKHCCDGYVDDKTGMWLDIYKRELRVGGLGREDPKSKVVRTDMCQIHPKAGSETKEYDMALLRIQKEDALAPAPPFDPKKTYEYNAICLPNEDRKLKSSVFEVAGTGMVNDDDFEDPSPELRRGAFKYEPGTCIKQREKLSTFCVRLDATDEETPRICHGDSGAPLMWKSWDRKVYCVGLVAYHRTRHATCEDDQYYAENYYTNVFREKEWIMKTMNDYWD